MSEYKSQQEKQAKSILTKFVPSYRYELDKVAQHLENAQMECELTAPFADERFWKKPKEWLDLLGFNQKRQFIILFAFEGVQRDLVRRLTVNPNVFVLVLGGSVSVDLDEQNSGGNSQRVRQNPCQDILPELISYLKFVYNSVCGADNALRVGEEIYRFVGLRHNQAKIKKAISKELENKGADLVYVVQTPE